MGIATASGLQNSYLSAISTADRLLNQYGTNRIEILRPTTNADGRVCQVYRFGETNLTVTMRDGVIDHMWRNGLPVNLGLSRQKLEGNPEWTCLSETYWAEMIRAVSFPRFFSENIKQGKSAVVVGTRHKNVDVVTHFESTRSRSFNWLTGGELFHMNDHEFRGGRKVLYQGQTREKGLWLWASVTPTETGGISFSNFDFSASFHPNGGLKKLKIRNPQFGDVCRYREWDEKGRLVQDRDLRNDPFPHGNLNELRICR